MVIAPLSYERRGGGEDLATDDDDKDLLHPISVYILSPYSINTIKEWESTNYAHDARP